MHRGIGQPPRSKYENVNVSMTTKLEMTGSMLFAKVDNTNNTGTCNKINNSEQLKIKFFCMPSGDP